MRDRPRNSMRHERVETGKKNIGKLLNNILSPQIENAKEGASNDRCQRPEIRFVTNTEKVTQSSRCEGPPAASARTHTPQKVRKCLLVTQRHVALTIPKIKVKRTEDPPWTMWGANIYEHESVGH